MSSMNIDDPAALARLDSGGMLGLVGRFGAMAADGWRAGSLTLRMPRPTAVVVAGMGGSGIGGQLLRTLVSAHCPVPVVPIASPTLPVHAGRGALVIACTYSGSTEETLAAFESARDRGASVLAITSGGRLADRAREIGCPLVMLPAGQPPRSALPYQLLAMLRILTGLGLAPYDEGQTGEAVEVIARLAAAWGPAIPTAANPAKHLARRLAGALPVIYGASADLGPVAYRWKTQVNEHAKTFAVANAFPELSHNETVGWGRVAELGVRPAVVILRDRDDGDRAAREVEATRTLAFGGAKSIDDVWSEGEGLLARMLSLVVLGDFTSVYLACLAGVDPTPIDVITAVKRRLQEGQTTRGTPNP